MRLRIASLIFVFGFCAAAGALAQFAPPDAGGNQAQLLVRVTYDNERGTPANIRVELMSAFGGTVQTQTSQGVGAGVTFPNVAAGKYRLRVTTLDGSHTETEMFDINRNEAVHTEFVRIKRPAQPQTSAELTVPASDINVPAKAKKEFDKGNEKLEAKNWADAKEHFERAIELYPQYAAAHSSLGMAYASLGQGEKAVATFREALKLDERQPPANIYLGQFYYDNQKFAEAVPYLDRAAAAAPGNPQVLTALANAQLKTGKLDDALANAHKVHRIPDHKKFAVSHLIAAEVLSSRKQDKEAAEEYKLFLHEDPKSPFAPRVHEALAKLEGAPAR